MTGQVKYATVEVLENERLEHAITSSAEVTIQGPVGYFSEAPPEHQFRLLAVDGDGLGGAAFDPPVEPAFQQALSTQIENRQDLWAVVRGKIHRFSTEDSMNRTTMPDACFASSQVLDFFNRPPHKFPRAGREP